MNVKQLQVKLRREGQEIPPYIVPLPKQAIEIVRFLLAAKSTAQRYLLAHRSHLKERISENTLNGALVRMGYKGKLTGHGIRATISTALNELGYRQEWVDAQLSHCDPNVVRAAYNHAEYVEQRRQMMQAWADRLDQWELEGLQGDGEPSVATLLPATKSREQPATDASEAAEPERGTEGSLVAPLMTIVSRRDQRPQPMLTDIQRERAAMVETFEAPENLPVPVFAKLAGKSRDQINREIKHRRLLSLTLGNRGHRIPEWQLDPVRQQVTRAVMERAQQIDSWTLYRVLSDPLEGWSNRIPVEIVTLDNLDEVVEAVCAGLVSIHEPRRIGELMT